MVDTLHPRATDLLAQMSTRNMYTTARERGITLSALLEEEDPSDPQERRTGLDAFCRMLQAAEIVTVSDPGGSYYADRLDSFRKDENSAAMFAEWAARQWRRVLFGQGTRAPAVFLSNDYALNSAARPYDDEPGLRMDRIQPAIPLSEVIAITTPTDTPDYRSQYLVEPSAADVRMLRIAESAEIPRARLATGQRTVRLHKFGRALEASYEALRRQRIDHIAIYIQRLGVQTQRDQFTAAMDIAINGDGNSGTSAVAYNLTTLDPAAVAGTLTLKGWLNFRMQWNNPYAMTVAFAQAAVALQMQLLNVGTANTMLIQGVPGIGAFVPINNTLADGIRLGVTNDAPANKIVGLDGRFGIQRLFETGSEINEADRWIERQVELLTMSMNEGYAVFDPNAAKVLNVNA